MVKKSDDDFYDLELLEKDFKSADLKTVYIGGIFLKLLPHKMMENLNNQKLFNALYLLREEFGDICSTLLIAAKRE